MKFERPEMVNTPARILSRLCIIPVFFVFVGPAIGLLLVFIMGALANGGIPTSISAVGLLVGVVAIALAAGSLQRSIPKKPETRESGTAAILITGLVLVSFLGFLAIFVVSVGSLLIAPIYAYVVGAAAALITGVIFCAVVSTRMPFEISILLSAFVGGVASMTAVFNTGVLKNDQWAVFAVGSVSGALVALLVLAIGLHLPGMLRPKTDWRQRTKVDEVNP